MAERSIGHKHAAQRQSWQSLHLAKEVRSIQRRAAEHDGRIVSIGPLLLFSTDTGDAWILEPADSLACRLAVGGDPIEIFFEETETGYAIGWQGRYRIEGTLFTYEDRSSNRRIAIGGYPVHLLQQVINAAERP
jgi:photosystem II stability/assembly factor-like uncharacterized protein